MDQTDRMMYAMISLVAIVDQDHWVKWSHSNAVDTRKQDTVINNMKIIYQYIGAKIIMAMIMPLFPLVN
jgi:hypothetical protein